MIKRGRHKVQFCPQGHDTFISGRDDQNRCIECHSHPKPIKKIRNQICSKGHDKNIVGFYKDGKCKVCVLERCKERHAKNKAEINARRKEKYITHPLSPKQFCVNNHDTFIVGRNKSGYCNECFNISVQKYRLEHPEIIKILSVKCHKERGLRVPKFGQRGIKTFYKKCSKDKTVDHYIPLRGDFILGLHVIWNLQYLSLSANCSKQNTVDLIEVSEWYGKLLEEAGLK